MQGGGGLEIEILELTGGRKRNEPRSRATERGFNGGSFLFPIEETSTDARRAGAQKTLSELVERGAPGALPKKFVMRENNERTEEKRDGSGRIPWGSLNGGWGDKKTQPIRAQATDRSRSTPATKKKRALGAREWVKMHSDRGGRKRKRKEEISQIIDGGKTTGGEGEARR